MSQTRELIEFCARGIENNRTQYSCSKSLIILFGLETQTELPSLFPSVISIYLTSSTIISQQDEPQIYILHLSSLLVWIYFTPLPTRPIFLDVFVYFIMFSMFKIKSFLFSLTSASVITPPPSQTCHFF